MNVNRRHLLTAGLASGLAITLPQKAGSQSLSVGAIMREKASAFLLALGEGQRNTVLFPFDTPARKAWNFMLGSRAAPGLSLEQMTAIQKDLALDLLSTGTSRAGLVKAMNIMLQQDILRDEWGKGSSDRNRERFAVQIYGTPAPTGAWSWRWEGHHLSLTFTMLDDQVISTTPSSYSSEPNTVPSGPHKGLVVLKEEETLGRALFSDLNAKSLEWALLAERSPGNILSNRGAENRVISEDGGIRLADLKSPQSDIAKRLIEVYTTDVLPISLGETQSSLLKAENLDSFRFGWAGVDLDGSIYYRIAGSTTLIEFASLRNQPLHLHAVFHDTTRNFGAHLI